MSLEVGCNCYIYLFCRQFDSIHSLIHYFSPQERSLSDFSLGGISQQRDEQEEIWEQSVSAACLVNQEEIIIQRKHMDRRRDGVTRSKIIGLRGAKIRPGCLPVIVTI